MMRHLGGPESPEAIAERHERYLRSDPSKSGLFAIVSAGQDVGWIGYWESEWEGEAVWECGWHVLPEAQGRGVATAAAALLIECVRARGGHASLHAFPSVDNAASNKVCHRAGLKLQGEVEVEYPPGSLMHANHWRMTIDSNGLVSESKR